jgi:hypothetical protein
MKKLLLILTVLSISFVCKAQMYSEGASAQTSRVISRDTIVLRAGNRSCHHLFVSREAEQLHREAVYAVLVVRGCVAENEDYLICSKCLCHLKVTSHNECVAFRSYSELLREIEKTDKTQEK